ncbi:type II toxin-antitoxin system RelE/ParE family toxin [Methyloglobulus sp.]|uniref:type II toxin-antitoxin system RelE/ParE family toxin n=1 Tax=Methyloglobulus sp. TaxID=2518622 RepID=UPI0032B833E2
MASYRLTEAAKEDLWRIYQYGVVQFGEAQADSYFNALFERFGQIADNPMLYPSVDYIRAGYRRSVCGVDSIFYRIMDDTVEIISILSRQDIDRIL